MTSDWLTDAEIEALEAFYKPMKATFPQNTLRLIAEVREWREDAGDVVFTYEMETGCECGGREIEDADDAQNGPQARRYLHLAECDKMR